MRDITNFHLESIARLGLIATPDIDRMYVLSPYVWHDGEGDRALLRLVNRAKDPHEKVARIHMARSIDGITFAIDDEPAIAPTQGGPDANGCEDPTVVVDGARTYVFYSGWSETTQTGTLLSASSECDGAFVKGGTQIVSSARFANPKEAGLVRCSRGDWALFFEYARDDASCIGLARASSLAGPWTIDEAFAFPTRASTWDSWHVSPGPIVRLASGPPTMFYNGADRDGAWRFGWVTFDEELTRIVERSGEPILVPPEPEGDEADIAFVASVVVRDVGLDLYYSVADKICKRARLVAK